MSSLKRVYLSGAMRGHPNENQELFDYWSAKLRQQGFEVWQPQPLAIGLAARDLFMLDCSKICQWADIVMVIPGWEKSLGVAAEVALAKAIELPVEYLNAANG